MDIVRLSNIFNCYSSIFPVFPNNQKRKNCFLAACTIWDQNINLEEIDQIFPHGGLIGYDNPILDFFLARSKVFRFQKNLHDSAGAVKATTNQGPGYCYMLPQILSSCLLGQITGLFFCIFMNIFYPRIFRKTNREEECHTLH